MNGKRAPSSQAADEPRPGAVLEVVIERLGASGDGEATLGERRLFVPFTLPGERWRVRVEEAARSILRAAPLERLAGPARAEPVCPHFGSCGGCGLQHLPPATYRDFVCARIREALARERLSAEKELPLVSAPLGSRRRLRLAFALGRRECLLGFRARRSHRIVSVARCPIARPELVALFAPLREAFARLPVVRRAGAGEAALALFAEGVDLVLAVAGDLAREDREALAELARALDLARVAHTRRIEEPAEPILVRRVPTLRYGRFAIAAPPGAFLQATEDGERALQAAVRAWVPEGARLLDLFAGTGALSLPIADRLARLELVERDTGTVAAVKRAVAQEGRIAVAARDLERAPVGPEELAAFDVVLLDPPRGGALAQCRALARSRIARIVYASCAPASFARDARVLADAGFRVATLQPIDQFLFAPAVELVALLVRESPGGREAS